jgi:stalled ribosome rescue protein Dom34
MKYKNGKECAGVCMDNTSAVLITGSHDTGGNEYEIAHTIKAPEHRGGGSEHGMNNAGHTNELKYFKAIATQLLSFDEILIFGSGNAQEQFQNYLKDDAQFNQKKITIDSAEHLTDPQKIATVRDFFKGHQS